MTLREFTKITIKVLRDGGVAEYLPTIAYPDSQEICTIQGIPDDVEHKEAIQKVVRRSGAERREFFFGLRSGPGKVTTGHHRPGEPAEFMDL